MRRRVYYRDPDDGEYKYRIYDTEKSTFLCHTPNGDLYRKRGSSLEFYIWKDENSKPYTVSWPDANNLVKTYGTRELHLKLFTTFGKSSDQKDGMVTKVNIDSYHRIKAERNASRLKLSLQAYIYRLIDKDDSNNNYCK